MSAEKEIQVFSCKLENLPEKMRLFSLCLRSLYVEDAVGSTACNATRIKEIRDQTRQDAIVFMKGLLPLSIQVVRYVQEFFEYYEGLELDEWIEYLPTILKEVTGYKQLCTNVVGMQEEMITSVKKRYDEAMLTTSGCLRLNEALKKKKAQLEKEADSSDAICDILCYIPFVNLIALPLLCKGIQENRVKAAAEGKQITINEEAIVALTDRLSIALSSLKDGLENLAGFFNVMTQELTTIHSRVNQTEPVQLHLKMMKKKAVEVKKCCRDFQAMVPGVRTDLRCIPYKPVDLRYFDGWLIKQQEVIKRNNNPTLTAKLIELLRQCEPIDEFQHLAINN